MEEEEYEETYIEVPTEDYYEDDDDDFALGDYIFLGFMSILICVVSAFIIKIISKNLKNVNLKVGKVEIGVESQIPKNKEKKKS